MGRLRIKCKSEQEAGEKLEEWKGKGFSGYTGYSRVEGHYVIITGG